MVTLCFCYGAVCRCLAIFLALVYLRDLTWDFSSEVKKGKISAHHIQELLTNHYTAPWSSLQPCNSFFPLHCQQTSVVTVIETILIMQKLCENLFLSQILDRSFNHLSVLRLQCVLTASFFISSIIHLKHTFTQHDFGIIGRAGNSDNCKHICGWLYGSITYHISKLDCIACASCVSFGYSGCCFAGQCPGLAIAEKSNLSPIPITFQNPHNHNIVRTTKVCTYCFELVCTHPNWFCRLFGEAPSDLSRPSSSAFKIRYNSLQFIPSS